MKQEEMFEHGISEKGQLIVRKTVQISDGNKTHRLGRTIPYSPADIDNMEGFDEMSKALIAATRDIKPEVIILEENGVKKEITYDRKTRGDSITVREITRFFSDGNYLGKVYSNTQSYDPGRSPVLCDEISRRFIETLHTPDVIAQYKAKMAESPKKI